MLLRKRLLHLDLIGHATEADRSAGILALTVPREIALAEINRRYNRPATLAAGQFRVSLKEALAADAAKVRPDLSEAEFASLLTAAGIRPYHQHSPILAESRRIDCSARRDLAQREASR